MAKCPHPRAGMPKLRFHDLRHAWASRHVQAATPLQELGGRASMTMGMRYAQLAVIPIAAWAGNIGASGTKLAHPDAETTNENGPEGPAYERRRWGG